MGKQLVMDRTGHSEHAFDKGNVVSMKEAEARFKELTGRGFTVAEKVPGGDGQFHVTRSFNPDAEETIFVPRYQGG